MNKSKYQWLKNRLMIVISSIAIIVFLILYLYEQCCLKTRLESFYDVGISISTSVLFYFIGRKANDNSVEKDLTERYISSFRRIRRQLGKDDQHLYEHYYKEEQGSVQNYDYRQLMLENNKYVFYGLDGESLSLYQDILKGRVDSKLSYRYIYPIVNKICNTYESALSNAKQNDTIGSFYGFRNPKLLVNKLKKDKKD